MKTQKPRGRCFAPSLLLISLPLAGLSLATIVPASAQAQQAPVGTQTIGEFIITGNKTFNKDTIIALSRHKVGDPCNEQVLNEIKANLSQTGYFGTQHNLDNPEEWVRVQAEDDNSGSGKCKVVIRVDENDPIKDFSITGSGPVKIEEIQNLVHAKKGGVYNYIQFQRDAEDIMRLYNSKGFVATLGEGAGMDDKGVLNVPITVVRVAEIRLVKNKKTQRKVVLRELQTKVGGFYNRDTWQQDRIRLLNLDLFEEVIPGEEIIAPGEIRLTFSLPEKRTGSISVGAGYSSRQQLIGRAEISETNFRGRGEAVNLLWETGSVTGKSSIELGFTEPYLDRHHTSLSIQLYDKTIYRFANSLTNTVVSGGTTTSTDTRYNEQRVGTTLAVGRPIGGNVRGSLSLRAENVRTDPLDLTGINASIIQDGPIYSIGTNLLHDSRDLILDPVKGGYQTFNLMIGQANLKPPSTISQGVAGGIYGNHTFAKSSIEGRQFFNLQKPRRRDKPDEEKTSLALRALLGASNGTLPFFEQYFVGGAETLRGYREDRFWGKYLMLGSVELRQPLARGLKGVIFSDVGDAWGGPYSGVNIQGFNQGGFKLHPSIGVGIRVRTPLGPIRLDYGYGDEGGQTHFSIGNVF
ncbi:MAG: Beta-barrel assembly machine subunit BamA [Chthonomonadaceae bacterium]|nr:Beta-barrel assembly machine subunit BamA [Chthonomonadaceae bacterium]